ncbi:MAG: hypothetical protein AB3N13_05860 [Arenibacterium sp.]
MVKTIVAAGVDMPKNAQGIAASAIARGADPASVFAARIADPAQPSEPATTVSVAISAFEFNAPAIQTETLDPAETTPRPVEE